MNNNNKVLKACYLYKSFKVSTTLKGCLSFLVIFLTATSVNAQNNQFDVVLAGYFPTVETNIRLDSRLLSDGTDIDFENDLGLSNNETMPVFSAFWHLSDRISLELSYFHFARNETRRIQETIDFGDESFNIDELVQADFSVELVRLSLGYHFFKSNSWILGAGGGFHVTTLDIGIVAPERNAGESANKTAPLPYISLYANYSFSEHWMVNTKIEALDIELNGISGQLFNISMGIDYKINDHLGAGLAFNLYDLNIQANNLTDDLSGAFQYRYSGPLLYFRYGF